MAVKTMTMSSLINKKCRDSRYVALQKDDGCDIWNACQKRVSCIENGNTTGSSTQNHELIHYFSTVCQPIADYLKPGNNLDCNNCFGRR